VKFSTEINGETLVFELNDSEDGLIFLKNGKKSNIDFIQLSSHSYSFLSGNKSHHATVMKNQEEYQITIDHKPHFVKMKDSKQIILEAIGYSEKHEEETGECRAPIPGLVSELFVNKGQTISKGDKLLILEAMKMENEITAHISGVIQSVYISPGQPVEKNALLIKIELDQNGIR
tara:strand:- start:92 stop:616 length:525 start_codon:yes stop_codon:yes gene_type:complete